MLYKIRLYRKITSCIGKQPLSPTGNKLDCIGQVTLDLKLGTIQVKHHLCTFQISSMLFNLRIRFPPQIQNRYRLGQRWRKYFFTKVANYLLMADHQNSFSKIQSIKFWENSISIPQLKFRKNFELHQDRKQLHNDSKINISQITIQIKMLPHYH